MQRVTTEWPTRSQYDRASDLPRYNLQKDELPKYDLPTAVTFLVAGLALGAMMAVIFSPPQAQDGSAVARSSRAWTSAAAGRG
jgi:hypothetical protein